MKEKKWVNVVSIAFLLILSAIVVNGASASYNDFGIATENLLYDAEEYVDVEFNTSVLDNDTEYYILKPIYDFSGSNSLTWEQVMAGGSPVTITKDTAHTSSDIILDVCGIWLIVNSTMYDNGTMPNGNNFDQLGSHFWVNSSQQYNIELDNNKLNYNVEKEITITVTNISDQSAVSCWIDLIRKSDNSKVFHRYENDGVYTFNTEILSWAGEYFVRAYRDIDDQVEHGYTKGQGFYDINYGSTMFATNYNYSNCGPWDPPEYDATKKTIKVESAETTTTLSTDVVYWGFPEDLRIDFDENVTGFDVKVFNGMDEDITSYFSSITQGNWYVNIYHDSWGVNDTGVVFGGNRTWYVILSKDIDMDGIEEWNTTIEFDVDSAPRIRIEWVDDDGTPFNNNDKDGEIPEMPDISEVPLMIKFKVLNKNHEPYDQAENITISGDTLYKGKLSDIDGATYSSGIWTVPVFPLMKSPNGEITIRVEWKGNGNINKVLKIGGSESNGTIVTVTPNEFTIDTDTEIQVTVKSADSMQSPIYYADVSLYWLKDDGTVGHKINDTSGTDEEEYYSFMFTKEDQRNQPDFSNIGAPRKIVAFAEMNNVGNGFAIISMKQKSDLEVEISQSTVMAGQLTEMFINLTKVGNNSIEGNIQLELYDEDGDKVDLDSDFGSMRANDLDESSNKIKEYFLIPGTYTIYGYNDTHNSEGNNATLIVEQVIITAYYNENPLDSLIWKVDEDINVTFRVRYNGQKVDGELKIYNMSYGYNAWAENAFVTVDVINGTATIEGLTIDEVPDNNAKLEFAFRPIGGSDFAEANGSVDIEIAKLTVSPKFMSYSEPALLIISAKGHGQPIENINISVKIPGITEMKTAQTDNKGIVEFAFMPSTTGIIKIYVEDKLTNVKARITSWKLYVEAPSFVNEGEKFTAIVHNGSINGPGLGGVAVQFNGVTVKSNSNGEAVFEAPNISKISYDIEAIKSGYETAETSIYINNVKKLIVFASNSKPKVDDTFTITVADDEGNAIIGAEVIFNGKTYLTNAKGEVLIKAEKEGNYTITANMEDFVESDALAVNVVEKAQTPGFEILMLVVAIGIALILLRRRK